MQCIAITKEGKECTRKAEYGEYCWQHLRIKEITTIRQYIKDNDMKITTEAEIFIDKLVINLLKELQESTYEELYNIINNKYILSSKGDKSFKTLILSYFQNQLPENIRIKIIEATTDLLFYEIYQLYKYEPLVNYYVVVRSIALNANLNNLFERYSIPQKYIVESLNKNKLKQLKDYTIHQKFVGYDLSSDFVKFIVKYIFWNYNFIDEDRKKECGYIGSINEFFEKWANYIKPYLPIGKLIKYKEGTDIVLSHDFWKDCTSIRKEETQQDLHNLVTSDVLNNILVSYVT